MQQATRLIYLLVLTGAFVAASERRSAELLEGAVQAVQAAPEPAQEESYQRVYEAFTKLLSNVGSGSLGNARRLVSRLNQLVGTPSSGNGQQTTAAPLTSAGPGNRTQTATKEQESIDERTDQILNRLDKAAGETDQNTLRQLNEDVSRLIGTLNDSYLRNIRRVIERINRMVGSANSSAATATGAGANANALHQSGDRLEDGQRVPGFPGWDELIVAVDRMQKNLAHFVRSSTKLITTG